MVLQHHPLHSTFQPLDEKKLADISLGYSGAGIVSGSAYM